MPFCYKKMVFISKNPQSVPARLGPSTHAGPPLVSALVGAEPAVARKTRAVAGKAGVIRAAAAGLGDIDLARKKAKFSNQIRIFRWYFSQVLTYHLTHNRVLV